ncbi:hypothetical protein FRC00_008296 [Tulasnella sp. 408]|nr:hypothetical protein FRC00_008296 [Tulasnella sp. 408]
MGVNKGDVLIIPAPNNKHKKDENKMTIHWQQMFRQRDGDYYVLVAKNKTQSNAKVPFYIQSEWYNEQGFNTAYNMRRIDDDNYEITIDDRHQYGSTNIWGQNQFIVWHDKDRKPYADRFLEKGFFTSGTQTAADVFRVLSGDVADTIQNTGGAIAQKIEVIGGSFIGIPLRTF